MGAQGDNVTLVLDMASSTLQLTARGATYSMALPAGQSWRLWCNLHRNGNRLRIV